jgi:hypothetical protein
MSWWKLAVLAGLAAGCASPATDAARDLEDETHRVDVSFEHAVGARLVAPSAVLYGESGAVHVVRPYAFVQDYDLVAGPDGLRADPVVAQLDEGLWLDVTLEHATAAGGDLRYRLRRAALRQPVERVTTTLGALVTPVDVEVPELVTSESDGVRHLPADVWTTLVRLANPDGSDPVTVLARFVPAPAEAPGPGRR